MFGRTWQHDVLRKYVILFGTLFNDIYINRDNSSGEYVQNLRVPLSYGPKEKFLARLDGDPTLSNKVAITLPRISFEMLALEYDPTRKLNTLNRLTKQRADAGTDDEVTYQYQPVPYDIIFQMSCMTKNAEDGTRIIEQILPYFTPDFTVSLNLVDEVDAPRDIPVILTGVTVEDSYEGTFDQRRAIIWTLNFTMKGWLYGPSKNSKLIKNSLTTFRLTNVPATATTSNTANTIVVSSRPGLTANGTATSNSSISVGIEDIKSTDNYGFITEFTENI